MLEALIPILMKAGAPILADIVRSKSPAAAVVVEKIGAALGTGPDPEAIVDAATQAATPGSAKATEETIRQVEAADPAYWQALAAATAAQADLLKREDERESAFSWAWRPAMSWLLIFLWAWAGFLGPVVNGATHAAIAMMDYTQLLGFSGLWLTIYGGGNTLKSIFAPKGG